jgi:2-polyprenyl-3-methyl-5-hydroxy-6-metoxy-1,4-benzoquinol methylase
MLKKIVPTVALPVAVKLSRGLGIQPRPFLGDIQQVERAVEYPWVLTNIDPRARYILDVGCCETFFPILLASLGFEVWGIDVRPCNLKHPNFKFIRGNILTAELPQGFFDVITLISTIEHIGLDGDGDIRCIERLNNLLTDNGYMLITVPYGKAAMLNEWRIYDAKRVERLCNGFEVGKEEFFKREATAWVQTTEAQVSNITYLRRNSCTRSIACIMIRHKG